MNPDTKRFAVTPMIWIGISFVIGFTLLVILSFPISLVAMIGVFLFMTYVMRRQ